MSLLTVNSNAQKIADLLDLATSQLKRPQIPEYKMVICAIGLKLVAVCRKRRSQCLCIQNDLLSVCAERGLCNLEEGRGDGGDGLMRRNS
jgi:hypothetical protein